MAPASIQMIVRETRIRQSPRCFASKLLRSIAVRVPEDAIEKFAVAAENASGKRQIAQLRFKRAPNNSRNIVPRKFISMLTSPFFWYDYPWDSIRRKGTEICSGTSVGIALMMNVRIAALPSIGETRDLPGIYNLGHHSQHPCRPSRHKPSPVGMLSVGLQTVRCENGYTLRQNQTSRCICSSTQTYPS